ncbi:transposase [Klebsiella pneumoniae]|nr:transposase [Klebsiella pneumoniae]
MRDLILQLSKSSIYSTKPLAEEGNSSFPSRHCWRDLPERYGPRKTFYNRFNRCVNAKITDRFSPFSLPALPVGH